jgi:hypothetical protein
MKIFFQILALTLALLDVSAQGKRISQYPAGTPAAADFFVTELADGSTNNKITLSQIHSITATGSTTARSLQARFSDEINVLDHGFVDDGTTDNSAAANVLFQSAVVDKKRVIFPRSASGSGVYLFNSTVTVTKDVYPDGAPGVKVKRGDLATGYTFAFTAPQTMGFNLIFDGNKANNSLSANRAPLVKYWAAHHGVTLDGYFTNHVVGIYDTDSRNGWSAPRLGFYNVAEHEGTYSTNAWHLSCAVNISHVDLTNSRAHFEFDSLEIINDAGPSATGKAGGGIIWGGSLANNARPRVTVKGGTVVNIGQSYPRAGNANHIAPFHAYEASEYDKIANVTLRSNRFGGIHLQNTRYPTVENVTIIGMDTGIAASEGTGGVVVGVDRVLGDSATDYGYFTGSNIKIKDVGNSPGIRIYGRGTASADEWYGGTCENCEIDNADGRAVSLVNVGGTFSFTGTYKGEGTGASTGAFEIQNLDAAGRVVINGEVDAYTFNGLYAASGVAGSLSLSGKISNGGAGTSAMVANVADRLTLDNVIFDGTDGVAYSITGAGTLYWMGVRAPNGSKSITWANVGNAEGILEGSGSPEGSVAAVKSRAFYLQSDGSTGSILWVKESDSGSASNTGWQKFSGVERHGFALGDTTTTITPGANKGYWIATYDGTLTGVYGSVLTPSTSGAVTFDIHLNGTTVMASNKILIDQGDRSSVTATTAAALTTTTFSTGDLFTFDIDAAGSGAAGPQLVFHAKPR